MLRQTKFTLLLLNELLLRKPEGLVFGVKASFIISGAILFLTSNVSVARVYSYDGEKLSYILSTGPKVKMIYHSMLFLTLFHAENLFYC